MSDETPNDEMETPAVADEAQDETPVTETPDNEGSPETENPKPKKARRDRYIDGLNRRAAHAEEEARRYAERVAQLESQSQPTPDGEELLTRADMEAVLRAEREKDAQLHQQTQEAERQQAYMQRAAAFARDHEDYPEVVSSIPYQLSPEVESAIMDHPKGPEIAYQLANDDDAAFMLASANPAIARAAVERVAKRLETSRKPQTPLSQAPEPIEGVSGRTPTEIPAEKLTDDQWYARRHRKRG